MHSEQPTSAFRALSAIVAACRAALPRKRDVILRICVRRTFQGHEGKVQLSDPSWHVWDGTQRGLKCLLAAAGINTTRDAESHQFTVAATHPAISFHDAQPASRDVTQLIQGMWAAQAGAGSAQA